MKKIIIWSIYISSGNIYISSAKHIYFLQKHIYFLRKFFHKSKLTKYISSNKSLPKNIEVVLLDFTK